MQRARDVSDIVFGGTEHHFRPVAVRHPAQRAQELVAIHSWHVPVEQDGIGHAGAAHFQRLLTILGLVDLEFEPLEDPSRHFADDA